jgi:outer membrane protein
MSARTRWGRRSVWLLGFAVSVAGVAHAASPPAAGAPPMEVLGLDAYVERAIEAAPELDVARWGVSSQEADLQKAQASRFLPEFSAINNFGFAPIARGTVLEPLDTVDTSSYGPFTSLEIRLVQPIFTWGKISDGIAAAAHAVGAKLAEQDGVEAAVVEQAKTLYYNIVLARSVRGILEETRDGFDDALETARERREDGDVDITEIDILYLRVGRAEVAKEIPRLTAGETAALEALRVLAGGEPGSPLEVRDRLLDPEPAELQPLSHYLDRLYDLSPAWRQIEQGVEAQSYELSRTEAEYMPDLLFTGFFGYSYAPDRDRQLNPFAYDPFNTLRGPGGFLTVRWPLNFHVTATRVQKARADLGQLHARRRQARSGLAVELTSAYEATVENRKAVLDLEDGRKAGRAILTLSVTNFDLAIGDAREILNALGNYARVSSSYYEAVREYNLSLAKLARILGVAYVGRGESGLTPMEEVGSVSSSPSPAPLR